MKENSQDDQKEENNILKNKLFASLALFAALALVFIIIISNTPLPDRPMSPYPKNNTKTSPPVILSWYGRNNESGLNNFLISIKNNNIPFIPDVDKLRLNYQIYLSLDGKKWEPIGVNNNKTGDLQNMTHPCDFSKFNLTPNTTYYWKIRVENKRTMKSTESPIWIFTTNDCPQVNYFEANPKKANSGDTVTLTWNVTNAEKVKISGPELIRESLPLAGFCEFQPSDTGVYRLEAIGNGWPVPEETTIEIVSHKPKIKEFSASDDNIIRGSKVLLTWLVNKADLVAIEPDIGEVDKEDGSKDVSLYRDTNFILTAHNRYGDDIRPLQINVTIPKPNITFWPDSELITSGATTNLNWAGAYARIVEITPLIKKRYEIEEIKSNGYISVSPTETTTYRINASNEAGWDTKEVKIAVKHCPTASINISPTNPKVNEKVLLQGVIDPCRESYIVSYSWYTTREDNANLGSGDKIPYIFKHSGEHEITLIVQDNKGGKNTTERTIFIRN